MGKEEILGRKEERVHRDGKRRGGFVEPVHVHFEVAIKR
jgi:hypothetical protein